MDLILDNKVIDTPIDIILHTLRSEIKTGKLKDILPEEKDDIAITCPKHKGGFERNPSCNVYTKRDNANVEFGTSHCLTCGYTAKLPQLVQDCFEIYDEDFGKDWLIERFGTSYSENINFLPEITLKEKPNNNYMDDTILRQYAYYHPYMWERKLTKEVVDKFKIGYNVKTKMLSFPVWDDKGKLVLITFRSVTDKRFYIEKDKEKPVYLLNFIKQEGHKTVYVTESQINALTLWSWGYPAVALIGTGSSYQYNILNKCPIRNYVLCLDGDAAGDKGVKKFIKNIRKDVLISQKIIPRGKDINDLTKEEFENLKMA